MRFLGILLFSIGLWFAGFTFATAQYNPAHALWPMALMIALLSLGVITLWLVERRRTHECYVPTTPEETVAAVKEYVKKSGARGDR